ncbi:MAG: NH(3)-dependent synthetase [Acidobacteriales bacterium]|nr:NH(3)-dependent synthetase [Terriglobales bacterium]
MKIALGQINPTVGDFSGNSAKIIDFAHRAKTAGADLIIFPEMSVCGYPARDMVERPAFVARSQKTIEKIAAETVGIAVICGFVTPAPKGTGKSVMNSAGFLKDGKVQFVQSKMLLPTYDVFDEQRNFAPASKQELLAFRSRKLALTICEDAWNDKDFWEHRLYSMDPVDELVRAGADFILNISASPFHLEKLQVREKMLSAIAVDNKMPVLMVNQVGGNDSVIFDGTSLVIAPDGRVVARAKSFEEDLIYFDTETLKGDVREPMNSREANAYAALVLGTRDYVCKCGFSRALIGLSGGIDSALVAAIAVDALGKDNVIGVGMPSPFSSKGSIDDARELAKNLAIRFEVVPISPMFDEFRKTMTEVFNGHLEDVTEENMQSRIRGNILMALSNKFKALVLATGNKSEIGVGYCTLYGDLAGALCVISDVPKTVVYKLSKYVNRDKTIIPISTIEKPPSAELRPGQKDIDTLPPYEVLDAILEDYVEDMKTVKQISTERNLDKELVLKIVRMIERSEYKRQQAPPGLKITEKAFGVGRRFPVAARYEV